MVKTFNNSQQFQAFWTFSQSYYQTILPFSKFIPNDAATFRELMLKNTGFSGLATNNIDTFRELLPNNTVTFSEFASSNTGIFTDLLSNNTDFFRVYIKEYWLFNRLTVKKYWLFQSSRQAVLALKQTYWQTILTFKCSYQTMLALSSFRELLPNNTEFSQTSNTETTKKQIILSPEFISCTTDMAQKIHFRRCRMSKTLEQHASKATKLTSITSAIFFN